MFIACHGPRWAREPNDKWSCRETTVHMQQSSPHLHPNFTRSLSITVVRPTFTGTEASQQRATGLARVPWARMRLALPGFATVMRHHLNALSVPLRLHLRFSSHCGDFSHVSSTSHAMRHH